MSEEPLYERMAEEAAELTSERDEAASEIGDRLSRHATLDVVDIAEGHVYPDENFSRY